MREKNKQKTNKQATKKKIHFLDFQEVYYNRHDSVDAMTAQAYKYCRDYTN